MESELRKSLNSLGEFSNVSLVGLLGTYEEGMDHISHFSEEIPKTIMWLGSSIGNFTREDGTSFVRKFQKIAMNSGDLFLLGIDRRNDPHKIAIAYNDPQGVTAEFIMNGLDHVNKILGSNFIDRKNFDYLAMYNEKEGRHEAYYKSKVDHVLEYVPPDSDAKTAITIKRGECIHIEYAYKYNAPEVTQLIHDSHLSRVESWPDRQSQYDLHLVQKPSFFFTRVPQQSSVPTIEEWQELWKSWDTVTMTMISPEMRLEKPIDLRHPFVFYFGHVPAFLDINLSKYFGEKFTEPENFADIFERGIDPDMDDPTKCNPHSTVPDKWPAVDSILNFRDRVRQRLLKVYSTYGEDKMTRSLGRVLWMTFEHEAMHLETILYMLMQSPNTLPPKGLTIPNWKKAERTAPKPSFIRVPSQKVNLGHNDNENMDASDPLTMQFGWDNERPTREVIVQTFKIQSRPLTNNEYLDFLKTNGEDGSNIPASWIRVENSASSEYNVRTVFGPVDMLVAMNWPVMLSHRQATKYALVKHMRLPTEAELRLFYALYTPTPDLASNIGFTHWQPADVPKDSEQVQTLGSGWEWTDTEFDLYEGFEKSRLYPGYSSDFFDKKHVVVIGGSWATHPRISTRKTFRNWYQRDYPYVFCSVRFCEI